MENLYTFKFDRWQLALLGSIICLMIITTGIGGYLLNDNSHHEYLYRMVLQNWEERLGQQKTEVERVKQQAALQLEALTTRVAELQSQFYQVESLSQRLAEAAQLSAKELAYYHSLGYQHSIWNAVDTPHAINPQDFMRNLDNIEAQISSRSEQLAVLEQLLLQRELTEALSGIGRIVDKGWLSSHFGQRLDPFTGKQDWHEGVDISGQAGMAIKAIAVGIVSFAGKKPGYGNIVELDHGNGFITRYAHNRNNLVVAGDIVNKGQMIAQMGSSGRSTGPHVHFEVLNNGNPVNPLPYIQASYNH